MPVTPVVSVIFTPPAGPPRLVAVSGNCADLDAALQQCKAAGTAVSCVRQVLQSTDPQRLRFAFPDTDSLVGSADDDRTLTGPATIAVTAAGAPLPCDLAGLSCADEGGSVACVDTLFAVDGSCGTTPDAQFGHFTALPPPNDYQALCTTPSPPCSGRAEEVRFTVDGSGNILLPMDWRGILVGQSVPIARLLRGSSALPAFAGGTQPIHIPSEAFLHSFSPEGGLLPPVFEPHHDPLTMNELTLFGSVDASQTVLWIGRRSPTFEVCEGGASSGQACTGADGECPNGSCAPASCVGGDNAGVICHGDGDCPRGECGAALFDFGSRLLGGVGPVLISRFGAGACQDSGIRCSADQDCAGSRCVGYRFEARDPVPLEGLLETPDVFVTVVPEAVEGRDLNGDGDQSDRVLLLADRRTGARRSVGEAGAAGRAATQIQEAPFSYPAVSVEGDIVAFLEAEPLQGWRDANGDGDRFDTILRVFRRTASGVDELSVGRNLAVDAAPLLNEQSVVVSDGVVYFRRSESAESPHRLVQLGEAPSANASLSADGQQIAFESQGATQLHDLRSGSTKRLTLDPASGAVDTSAQGASLSNNGRYVAVAAQDQTGVEQIYLHDRDSDGNGRLDEPQGTTTTLLTASITGEPGDRPSILPFITPDGRYVSFLSRARNFSEHTPTRLDTARTWIRDVTAPVADINAFTLASRSWNTGNPTEFDDLVERPTLSADGRFVAFASFDSFITPGDDNDFCINFFGTHFTTNCSDVFVHHRLSGRGERVSIGVQNEFPNSQSLSAFISADGRQVAYESFATNLVSGDTNGVADVFVRDRQRGLTSRVSVASDAGQANGPSLDRNVALSADGRYVVFGSTASNLVPGDTNTTCIDPLSQTAVNCADIFIHDQLTGFTERVSVATDGGQGNADFESPAISADGKIIAFEGSSSTLTGAPTCDSADATSCRRVFVSSPDTSPANDLNGDGDVTDTLLQTFDTRSGTLRTLCPARDVVVAGNAVAFLRPEWEGDAPGCPAGPDLNGDGDTDDLVIHLVTSTGEILNLGKAATQIRLVNAAAVHVLIALVSEAGQGGTDLNSDGDTDDSVVQAYNLDNPAEGFRNFGRAADFIDASGNFAVFMVSEAAQQADLNGDGDLSDRIPELINLGFVSVNQLIDEQGRRYPAEEVVVGPSRLPSGDRMSMAFRSREADGPHGDCDLNGDGDCNDDVLIGVLDGRLLNSGQAVIPCTFQACDPRRPYRVFENTVKFLTLEADQDEDLNGDGDKLDVVLQTFNLAAAAAAQQAAAVDAPQPATPAHRRNAKFTRTVVRPGRVAAAPLITIGAVSSGRCTDNGRACASAADCSSSATCFVPPGTCELDLGIECVPAAHANSCGDGSFCVPSGPGKGTCHSSAGACGRDTDCAPPAHCVDAGQTIQQLVSPLAANDGGNQVFSSAGLDADLIVATAADSDHDEISDPFDNCPRIANVDQSDTDGDGVGNACQSEVATPASTPTAVAATPTAIHASNGKGGGCNVVGPSDQGAIEWLMGVSMLILFVRRCARSDSGL